MSKRFLNLLLVEDDAEDATLIRELLAEIGTYSIETRWAPTYSEAKVAMSEGKFDVCLVDNRLGALTGLDLIREAQTNGFNAPMILLSGYEEYELDVKAMNAGAADFMVKVVLSASSLERSIRHSIDRFQTSQVHRIQSDLIGAIIGEGIYALDIEGKVTFMNAASEKILGWNEDDLLGKNIHDVIHHESPEGISASLEQCPLLNVLTKGNTCHLGDESFIHRNGKRVSLSITSAPIFRDGRIAGAVFNFHDITEQKRAENERRVVTETLLAISATADLSDLLAAVREALSKAIYAENFYVALYETAGQLAEVPFYVDVYGGYQSMTQMMGKGMSEFVFGRSRPTLMTKDVIERLVSEGELKVSGTPPAVWVGIPLRSPAGILGVMVLQHFEDEDAYNERDLDLLSAVGAYVAQTIEGKRIENALSLAARRERAMIENALDVICTVDGDGRFVTINPACFRMWGYQPKELIGKRYIDYVVPSHASRTTSIDRAIQSGSGTTDFENQYFHKNGSIVDVRWTSYWSETDRLLFAVAHDITERKRMELDLERTRDAALESARLKSEFLANMSHEIRTPMNGVVGMTELLLDTELSDQQREFTRTIAASADSLLHIIDDILDFSKIEAGKMRLEKIDFDLHEVVEVPVEMFAARAKAIGIEIASLIHSDVPTRLLGDPVRLQQILTNLIGNAVKFTEKGDVFINVTQKSESTTNSIICFEIKDTGIGISDAAQRKLFRSFVQADGTTTRKYGGTGLGLAISKQLVELMGGEIEMKSKIGEGSVFSFTVPFEKGLALAEAPVPVHTDGLHGSRVLIVDDKETNRKILLHQTLSWGMAADEAASAVLALEILRRSPRSFDIVLLDLMMPEMDGFALARAIKADAALSHLKLVLLTSFAESGHNETVEAVGIDAFLRRPIRQSQIYNCLIEVLNGVETIRKERDIVKPASLPAIEHTDTAPLSHVRILVAEDNDINMLVARNQLRSLGYTADFVRNGREAVEAVKKQKYDVVLMDGQMPEKDGFEATAEIRSFEGSDRHTTIIAVTAHALEGDREKCIAAGMDDYLGKPVKIEALKAMLCLWIERQVTDDPEWPEELTAATDDQIVDRTVLEGYKDLQDPGEPSLVAMLIDLFLDRTSSSITVLRTATMKRDMAEVLRQAHAIKGSSGNIGANRMAQLSSDLEATDNAVDAGILAASLEEAFEQASEILVSIRDEHNT